MMGMHGEGNEVDEGEGREREGRGGEMMGMHGEGNEVDGKGRGGKGRGGEGR